MDIKKILPGDSDITGSVAAGVGSLGNIQYTVSRDLVRTFRDFSRKSHARFAQHDILNQTPQLEYLGDNLDEINFRIQLLASLGVSPAEETQKLRDYCLRGEVLPLVIGTEVFGNFVITEIEEKLETVDNHGRILISELSVSLKQYA